MPTNTNGILVLPRGLVFLLVLLTFPLRPARCATDVGTVATRGLHHTIYLLTLCACKYVLGLYSDVFVDSSNSFGIPFQIDHTQEYRQDLGSCDTGRRIGSTGGPQMNCLAQ